MAELHGWRRLIEPIMSIGALPGESETHRGGRRVFMMAFVLATLLSIPQSVDDLSSGYTVVAIQGFAVIAITIVMLLAIKRWPRAYAPILNAMFVVIFVAQLVETWLFGGLMSSGLIVMFGLTIVMAMLITLGFRTALVWFAAFVASVIYAYWVGQHVSTPTYVATNPSADAAFNLTASGIVTLAVLGYFIRQRDRFQRRSDELLRNTLPDAIVERLKDAPGTIADDIGAASVLFADVVDFTPMSAALTPAQLVELLDEVFSSFDAHAEELGLEKIKTVGDAYMVASGVPQERPDHAHAIAELALRIRDHERTNPVDGSPLRFRIGIASGPVTAGVIGTHKFSFDLWGDTVNTASRMESSGVPGKIQLSPEAHELLRDDFVCEPRGPIQVKGKQEMETWFLVGQR
jgi:adenylate cyclase